VHGLEVCHHYCFVASMVITGGQLALMIFWIFHTICWLPGLMWRFYRQTNDGIQRAVHRAKVASHLDSAAQTIGPDYEFHGPLFVYQERNSQKYGDSTVLESWTRWCGFLCVALVNKLSRVKPHLRRSQLKDMYMEVFPTGHDIGNFNRSAWERPIQKLRLH
jgi:hypothetical protein